MTYDSRDFEYDTPPRIMGSETEYNIQHMTLMPDYRPDVDSAYYHEEGRDIGDELWLENGARLYFESSGVTEYATPEVTSAHELLDYERTGEHTVQAIATGMASTIGAPDDQVFKRSGYDLPGRDSLTAGQHENYITSLPLLLETETRESHPLHRGLKAYLSTRGIWAGAGLVRKGGFELTQKIGAITFDTFGKASIEGLKPAYIVHNDATDLNRLEIRLGDGNMSDWAIIQKFAFTSLVLRMIEHGDFPQNLFISKEKQSGEKSLRATSRFEAVKTQNSTIHPARHQRFIAEAALEFASHHPDTPIEEIRAAKEIIEVCHQIEDFDRSLAGVSTIADRVDWAAKLTYIRDQGIAHPTHDDIDAVYYDLQWENIAANGIAREWYENYSVQATQEGRSNEYATYVPPATRAMARTAFLSELAGSPHFINWDRVDAGMYGYRRFDDPYQSA